MGDHVLFDRFNPLKKHANWDRGTITRMCDEPRLNEVEGPQSILYHRNCVNLKPVPPPSEVPQSLASAHIALPCDTPPETQSLTPSEGLERSERIRRPGYISDYVSP